MSQDLASHNINPRSGYFASDAVWLAVALGSEIWSRPLSAIVKRPSANNCIASGNASFSASNTRAASAETSSSSSTFTARWMIIGPWSYSLSATWTVQPVILAPKRSYLIHGNKKAAPVFSP